MSLKLLILKNIFLGVLKCISGHKNTTVTSWRMRTRFRRWHQRTFQQNFPYLFLFHQEFLFKASQTEIMLRLPFYAHNVLPEHLESGSGSVPYSSVGVCSPVCGIEVLVKCTRINKLRVFVWWRMPVLGVLRYHFVGRPDLALSLGSNNPRDQ